MTQLDGELSPPFEIVEPEHWRAPIIFNSPHSGSVYPLAFLNASRIDIAALRRSEDSFMDELIGGLSAQGFPTVRVNFPRSYVDVNREPYELDPRMFTGRLPSFANTRSMRVAGGLGTIPRVVGDGQEIYRERLSVDDALGRIEALARRRREGTLPRLAEVFALPPATHGDVSGYAACWAAAALFTRHPAYADAFATAERAPLDARFTERFLAATDRPRAERDFAAFLADVDYSVEPERMAIDWSAGRGFAGRARFTVDGTRGWLNTGIQPQAGDRISYSATGRITVGDADGMPLESEADGISIAWYRGRPVGRLLVGQWRDEDAGMAGFEVLATGARGSFTATRSSPIYVKVNDPPGSLPDNTGGYRLTFEPAAR